MKRLVVWVPLLFFLGCQQKTALSPQPTATAVTNTIVGLSTENNDFESETQAPVDKEKVPLLDQLNREYTQIARAVLPSVVSLSCTHGKESLNDRFTFTFPFHSSNPRDVPTALYGSGVLISRDGYIVTNEHVIEGADEIDVQLNDRRKFKAEIIASDEQADLAVLKIAGKNFPALPWGNSDELQIGEQVFAIGNPFNLNNSFANGIVSGKERNLDAFNYDDFIQTNAAINPGNSGGALVDIQGKLVGINAAIASNSRVNMGVGFAIPSNLARFEVESLIRKGKVVRGFLGVTYQPEPIDDAIRDVLGISSDSGALVNDVWPDSPAEKAKLQHGDFITAIDDHKISNSAELRLVIAQIPIGQQVKIDFLRAEKPRQVSVTISEFTDSLRQASKTLVPPKPAPLAPPKDNLHQPVFGHVLQGVQVVNLDESSRAHFHLGNMINYGVVLSNVEEGSPAQLNDLTMGDVLKSAKVEHNDWVEFKTQSDFLKFSQNLKPDQAVLLLISRSHRSGGFVLLDPEK